VTPVTCTLVRPSRAAALVLAGLLTLAACGDDGGQGAGESATTAPVTAAPTTAAPDAGAGSVPATTATPADPGAPATSAPAGSTTAAPTAPPATVPPLLDVTAETVSDGTLSLAAFAGKPVALWFWSPG
jgi:hypothetical protein